jgi:hypothetical protein
MTEINQQARNWAIFCHLAALSVWLGVPFGNVVIPLLVWLIKKDEIPLVEQEGKESLNFEITISIFLIGLAVIGIAAFSFGLLGMSDLSFPIMIVVLAILLVLAHVVLVVYAAFKVSTGQSYRYPLTIRFIR